MKTWTDRALLGLHVAGAVVLILLTLVICYDVAGRLLLNKPFAGTAELAGVGVVLITFMQAPYVIRERKLQLDCQMVRSAAAALELLHP